MEIVGVVSERVANLLGVPHMANMKICCGESNRKHMEDEHPEDYAKYGDQIEDIINNPTYIAKHPNKDSIEYVRVFADDDGSHVLIAVRATKSGNLFARTLFRMSDDKVQKYHAQGAFIPI